MVYCGENPCRPAGVPGGLPGVPCMVFSSLFFLFFFLVLCYGLYLIMPDMQKKNGLLLVFSLVFYAWGGPVYVGLLCVMTLICFVGAILLAGERPGGGRRKLALGVTVGTCLVLLCVFKYTDFLVGSFQGLFGLEEHLTGIVLPIGISFYTFQLISYVVDVYRGDTQPQSSYAKLLLYAALFHQCIAGPIVRYADISREIDGQRTVTLSGVFHGMVRLTVGLAKKVILANSCAAIADTLLPATGGRNLSAMSVLLGIWAYGMQVYLDFSAYSDMAIGMGFMVGFHFRENFRYPYTAVSVTDFWRRWHISLSSFFRDYVYIPLGGNRCAPWRHVLNILIVWALTGLWHGASWNYVLWGLYFAMFLILEKFLFRWDKNPTGWRRPLRGLYTLAVVFFSWFLFRFENLSLAGTALAALFGFGNGFCDMAASTTFVNNVFILMLCVLACTPVVPLLSGKLRTARQGRGPLSVVCAVAADCIGAVAPAVLLVLSALALVGNSYNPFLYFRF